MTRINKEMNTYEEYHTAFEQTNYVVYPTENKSVAIKINHTPTSLLPFFPELKSWAVITAWNPLPDVLSLEENNTRNEALRLDIEALGLQYCPANGIAINEMWMEEGFFIQNCTQQQANTLAAKFGQLAFVYGEISEVAKLIYTEKR